MQNPLFTEDTMPTPTAPTAQHVAQDLAIVAGSLRAVYELAHSFHLRAQGREFYADHLLFQRVYEETYKHIDPVLEKMIGLTKKPAFAEACLQARITCGFLDALPKAGSPEEYTAVLLAAVTKLNAMVSQTKDEVLVHLDDLGMPSDGLDNLLQGVCDNLESHVYLLGQQLGYPEESPNPDNLGPNPPGEAGPEASPSFESENYAEGPTCACGCAPGACDCPPECECGCNVAGPKVGQTLSVQNLGAKTVKAAGEDDKKVAQAVRIAFADVCSLPMFTKLVNEQFGEALSRLGLDVFNDSTKPLAVVKILAASVDDTDAVIVKLRGDGAPEAPQKSKVGFLVQKA